MRYQSIRPIHLNMTAKFGFMKNKWMLVSFLIMVAMPFSGLAQEIDNKINVSVEYGTGFFHGEKMFREKNFKYPSFYRNFDQLHGSAINLLIKTRPQLSLGVGIAFLNASGWMNSEYSDFDLSEAKVSYISPLLRFHSKFSPMGFFNKGRLFIELAPNIGLSKISLSDTIFTIQTSTKTILPPISNHDLSAGIKVKAGFEWTLSNYAGITASYALQHVWVKSEFYNDRSFTCSLLNVGLIFRFHKDKRFNYK